MTRILLVAFDPETVDFTDPTLPSGLTAEKIHAGLQLALQQLRNRGWEAETCFVQPDATAGPAVAGQLAAAAYDCVLIGGYGMGFTLRAALEALGPAARVTVAELVPAVMAWARGPMAHLSGASLEDPRLTLREGDVGAVMRAAPAAYDAILLDVDNGPEGLSRPGNDRLYDREGLATARRALRPGGVLAVWSAAPEPAFARRLARAGYAVEEVRARASAKGKGSRYIVWLATAPART